MTLGLPADYFIRELLVVAVYAAAAIACATRWREGMWARIGACAATLGAALAGFSLSAWVLYSNDLPALMDFRSNEAVGDALSWLGLLALAGVLVAIVLDRGTSPSPNRSGRPTVDEGAQPASQ
ncbi:hypothetical protein DJ010_09240 [Nocardioides silvaticus]|uniref:Uncharacterized protein n=1 Tax=Nocardioides silvaticus TaxID=2201891 RepID=A0A316TJ82_9ACTN|nr:hypothetical protein [Nocardioides silvaticus]PWN03289.1 hypothetical protein DJ010_09240 [Nocardioides silvaticus]